MRPAPLGVERLIFLGRLDTKPGRLIVNDFQAGCPGPACGRWAKLRSFPQSSPGGKGEMFQKLDRPPDIGIPDFVYYSFRPMLAVSGGDLLALSTPAGERGFFFEACRDTSGLWQAHSVPATECPRIPQSFLDEERRAISNWWFRQEYCCEFVPLSEGLFPRGALDSLFIEDTEPV